MPRRIIETDVKQEQALIKAGLIIPTSDGRLMGISHIHNIALEKFIKETLK